MIAQSQLAALPKILSYKLEHVLLSEGKSLSEEPPAVCSKCYFTISNGKCHFCGIEYEKQEKSK